MQSSPEGAVGSGCDKLWQHVRTLTVCLARVFAEWRKSFTGLLNVASVCVWTLSTSPRVCIYIYTCQHVLRVKMTLCQMKQEKTCRTESYCLTQREPGILWFSLCVSVRGLVENLRRWLFSAASARNAVHVFFHAVVHFLYYRRRLSVVVILLHWTLPNTFFFHIRNPLSRQHISYSYLVSASIYMVSFWCILQSWNNFETFHLVSDFFDNPLIA